MDPSLRIAPRRTGGHWTVADWQAIDFNTEAGWQTAITIFEDRISYRFFRPIEAFERQEGAGFAVMALDCLLIETLMQFMEGVINTPKNHSVHYFRCFLTRTKFGQYFTADQANIFYKNVRCGILHQAETKGDTRLWTRKTEPFLREAPAGNDLYLRRDLFHELLLEEYGAYIHRLHARDLPDKGVRRKFKRKMDAICRCYTPTSEIGILAYGSLIDEPGNEILPYIIERLHCFQTPFNVEYARRSTGRKGAPTLTEVKDGVGKQVIAQVLILDSSVTENQAKDMLYRREINRVGDLTKTYAKRESKSSVTIMTIPEKPTIPYPRILYARMDADLTLVTDCKMTDQDKAAALAQGAIGSVTDETYAQRRDGIAYLDRAIHNGIETKLTPFFKQAILAELGAADLEEARQIAARRNGVPGV